MGLKLFLKQARRDVAEARGNPALRKLADRLDTACTLLMHERNEYVRQLDTMKVAGDQVRAMQRRILEMSEQMDKSQAELRKLRERLESGETVRRVDRRYFEE